MPYTHGDAEQLSSEQILREYKQQSSVELRFKFLKDPIEERIRTAVVERNIRIEPVRGWYAQKPTAKQIILMLEPYE